jgi:hypothetical protein
MPEILATGSATFVVPVKFKVSIPAPPFNESATLSVATSELKVSLPEVLVVPRSPLRVPDMSVLVVSDLFCTQNGVNTYLFYLYFDIRPDIDSITTIDHQ